MSVRLLKNGQLKSGGYGLDGGAHPLPHDGAGNSRSGIGCLAWEAAVKVYGVAAARPQGQSEPPWDCERLGFRPAAAVLRGHDLAPIIGTTTPLC